ncbi:MAG: hypothetical protein MN733_17550 [Nitrososphaera sp.]|nr:hypothetical protein [Nitrososphaera sp.]
MNEMQLKLLFCRSLISGHVRFNSIIPTSAHANLRIVEEAQFRSFDLVISAVVTPSREIETEGVTLGNVLARSQMLEHSARSQRCKIDHIRFFPVELKSDDDCIDERLPNQVIDAILTFGLSIVVFDVRHSKRVRSARLDRILPASIICYTGIDDYFEVVSVFDRFVSSGILAFDKASLARLLGRSNAATGARLHSRLSALQRLLEKIAFNQLYSENLGLEDEEMDFLQALGQIPVPKERRIVSRLEKETANARLTDYM